MANDALDPGPEATYLYWPRNPDGTPDEERRPTGVEVHPRRRWDPFRERTVHIDLQPYDEDGVPIVPPVLP
jgi:hypothetical protein